MNKKNYPNLHAAQVKTARAAPPKLAFGGVCKGDVSDFTTNTEARTSDTSQSLLDHRVKELRPPSILLDYDKLSRQWAVVRVDYNFCRLIPCWRQSSRLETSKNPGDFKSRASQSHKFRRF